MSLAFVALIAVVNGILGGIGGWFGFKHITLESILGYVFSPIAFVIGVPWHEALGAGSYIGQKLVLNEFVAYSNFGPHIADFSKKRLRLSALRCADLPTSLRLRLCSAHWAVWPQAAVRTLRASD